MRSDIEQCDYNIGDNNMTSPSIRNMLFFFQMVIDPVTSHPMTMHEARDDDVWQPHATAKKRTHKINAVIDNDYYSDSKFTHQDYY